MRILIASRRGTSGIRTYTDALAEGLASLAHEVFVLDETIGSEERRPVAGGNITLLPLKPPPTLRSQLGRFDPILGWLRRAEVRRRAREVGADVVHVTNLDLAPRGHPLVVTAWDPLNGPVPRIRAARSRGEDRVGEAAYALVDAAAYRRSDAIVAATPMVEAALEGRFRVEMIPPFLPDEEIRQPTRRSEDVAIIANSFGPKKGLDFAISALALVREVRPESRLKIIGRGSEALGDADLPEYCDVAGGLSSEALRDTLSRAGCVAIPSMWEEFGYVGLEALGAGTPVACFAEVGVAGLSGGGVFVARRRDAAALAEQILLALDTQRFRFPDECRSSEALPRLVHLYESVSRPRR